MQHMNLEELARCVEEDPTSVEAAHLAVCPGCSEELEAMREQTRELAVLPTLEPVGDRWPALRSRLMEEGLMTAPRRAGSSVNAFVLRIAAALALFVGGAVSGAMLFGDAPGGPSSAPATLAVAATEGEAGEQLRDAEQLYLAALTRYAELTQGGIEVDPLNRLAALEGIVLTAQAALREAPADPVINGYLFTAMGQRDAMLRQISRTPSDDWF